MKTINIYNYCLYINKVSRISFLNVLLATCVLYFVLMLIGNNPLFLALFKIKTLSSSYNEQVYLSFIENLNINDSRMLAVIVVSIIASVLIIIPIKINISNRILPINYLEKFISIFIMLCFVIFTSLLIVGILNESIIYIIRNMYYDEALSLKEKSYDFYQKFSSGSILNKNFVHTKSVREGFMILSLLSLFFSLLVCNLALVFNKNTILKSTLFLIVVISIAVSLKISISSTSSIYTNNMDWAPTLLLITMFISNICCFIYLLKEREA